MLDEFILCYKIQNAIRAPSSLTLKRVDERERMSLDRFKAQAYAPVRLQSNQVAGFFDSLRKREFVRGDQPTTLKLTNKPFQTRDFEQVDLGVSDSKKKKTSNSSRKRGDVGVSQSSKTPTKKGKSAKGGKSSKSQRDKLEALLKAANL